MISLPGGVFKPYAGVSTGILIFTKAVTDKVFYDIKDDEYIDDKGNTPKDDLPDYLQFLDKRRRGYRYRSNKKTFIPASEIPKIITIFLY